ncbi:MAG: shikimate dehydrogenase [Acidobacteriota bacterium]
MNQGKICISVSAKTPVELIEQIRRAESVADIIEVRFDSLAEIPLSGEVLSNIFKHKAKTPWIATFRPHEQGGGREMTLKERESFWTAAPGSEFRDVEEDIIPILMKVWQPTLICSQHDFAGVPVDIDALYERLVGTGADIVKIAYAAADITDTIPVWRLLKRAKTENKRIIPIAMGDAGKFTRIIGTARGAFLTYAPLDEGGETAPGQVTARDLVDVYRVKERGEHTAVFGVIGDPISQSLSPYMHNPAFTASGIDAVFVSLLVKDIGEFMRRMVRAETREVDLNFGGFSVTMPHKQSIMPFLDVVTPMAEAIGAVNTVEIEDGVLTGYNTDAYGFITPLLEKFGALEGARVAVFGAGGAARAVVYALKHESTDITIFARDAKKANDLAAEFGVGAAAITNKNLRIGGSFDILVDATPLGMEGPLENKALFTADELDGLKFVFDLVTKPADTPIIREAKLAGISTLGGLEMLVAQGARQFQIWTATKPPLEAMKAGVLDRMKHLQK